MATDATLVNAAYREAMANVPKFDPNIAKSQAGLISNIMDPITEAIETKDLELKQKNEEYDNLKDDQIAKFTDTADAINIRLSSFDNGGRGAGMHEQIYNNTYNHLDELKQEYELYNTVGDDDTPENKKKRIEILGKLEGVKNSTIQLRTDVLAIGKLAGSKDGGSQMSKHGMTASEIAMTNEILNMDGDYSNVKQKWDKKTNSMFFDVTIPDDVFSKLPPKEQKLGQTRTWSAKDIKENFYPIPKEKESNLIQQSADYEKAGKKAKWDDKFDLQVSADETTEILGNDKKAASHIFQTRQHGQPKTGYNVPGGASGKWEKGSWANALEAHTDLNETAYKLDPTANMEIVTDLVNSGKVEISEIDTDGKDGISSEELEAFMSAGNRDEVIDALVNHKNPLYNHKLSVEEFSMWRAKQIETKFNENKPDEPEVKTDYNQLTRKAQYEDYIKNRNNPLANYQNRKVEFQLFLKETDEGREFEKTPTTSDELINLDNKLNNLMSQSSFDTESYVDVFGKKIGYFPGKGFAPVKIAKEGDAGGSRKAKGGEVLRPQIKSTKAPAGGYFKTPADVFQNYSIPTTYSGLTSGVNTSFNSNKQ